MLPKGSYVVPFWGSILKSPIANPKKGTTLEPWGSLQIALKEECQFHASGPCNLFPAQWVHRDPVQPGQYPNPQKPKTLVTKPPKPCNLTR